MADKYDNTNRGVLFENYRKDRETSPDYKGEINVEGKFYWLNAWVKTSKKGNSFLSVSIAAKKSRDAQKPEMADEIPF